MNNTIMLSEPEFDHSSSNKTANNVIKEICSPLGIILRFDRI